MTMATRPDDDSFAGHDLQTPNRPVLLSVPHAGRDYPDEILRQARVSPAILQRLEDRYVDLLTRDAIAAGFPCIIARRPRAWIDLNRAEREIDVAMVDGLDAADVDPPSAKVRGGLGLVPRWLGTGGELWRGRLPRAHLEQRIARDHAPYHAQIAQTLDAMQARFGGALLLDVHSMPSLRFPADRIPRIVIGDRFGRSAANRFASLALDHARSAGFVAALNHPYAGGHILARHGQPARNIHALQLECDRALYLDARGREPDADKVGRMAQWVHALALRLEEELAGRAWLHAAE